ncbi:MAG: DUF2959 domain-containing protein [Syntrophaceae bacterium]|nr:DUF2959 domain-containing protein [Syntrophaceae bacterium]
MNKKSRLIIAAVFIALLGCNSCDRLYFNAMEKIGIDKRDIMVDRVKDARETQDKTKKQFVTAMEQFQSLVNFQGGNLEKEYKKLNATFKKSKTRAEEVRQRIKAVENVSAALFEEWRAEIKQYSNESLRRSSQQKYDLTHKKYTQLISAMKKAEAKLEPALAPLRDQVLFMKHNLNAKAIAGLNTEVVKVQANVDQLVKEMEKAITQADSFINALQVQQQE